MLSHFEIMPERDGQTDGQNSYIDTARDSIAVLSRDKSRAFATIVRYEECAYIIFHLYEVRYLKGCL